MKILHTSDWHLGHTLYNYDRTPEQQAFLKQLARIVQQEKPDVMVVCGDVYHYSVPSAATQRMYTEGMLKIHEACPEMTIVVTAGNHDSSSKLEIDSSLWQHFGVKVIGNIERNREEVNLDRHIIEIKDGKGKKQGYIIAVPHVYPQNFPTLDTDTPREERQARFFQALLDKAKKLNTEGLPIVLMAHLAVEGSDRTGHDESNIGGMETVSLHDMGKGYDYLALGHIHCPQDIKGSGHRARYCGTPLPVSFDETYPHSVSIVELNRNEEPQTRTAGIENPMPLVTLPHEPMPFEEALRLLEEYPADKQAYIRLNVLADNYQAPDCMERAANAVKDKACKFCCIKSNRERQAGGSSPGHLSIQEIQEKSPLDIAKLYYRETEGEEMDEELCGLMNDILRQVKEKEKQ
ncbi:exonuclease SbcCD subunit D [Bacteroides helcogenes]|uniref:Nuclease SbcCD subunit D n=1 Tax=Bacteroides helcogenes (strain ATCC 35417 / DSM 20613 / JCM 6297 / CCUG 15421 / P 36-108) TaxID=693979 RepID=E6SVT4_BACT6|nr:exonuclease SbcCD subunit D [Bacteroides helcogenes]ADV44523.1 Exodeoxyribonuclease I subunit D [Bacteroides helcogenes P 36-108]MDY5238999.1 exonuclease SbcCD subunit D [Bacteroides helcogenes]